VRKSQAGLVAQPQARLLQWGRTRSSAEIERAGPLRSLPRMASMGPHSFECGNMTVQSRCTKRLLLQWGRTRSSAEIPQGGARAPDQDASMGPHSFECGNARKARRPSSALRASMGPHSFECGNHCVRFSCDSLRRWLQWGRTRSSAEIISPVTFPAYPGSRFNGAALVRVRK